MYTREYPLAGLRNPASFFVRLTLVWVLSAMRTELPIISFVCAVLLAAFIPLQRVRGSVANLSIVSWLVGSNIVHGINAIIWSGNVDIHVPVWCDIGTTSARLFLQTSLTGNADSYETLDWRYCSGSRSVPLHNSQSGAGIIGAGDIQ